MSAPRPKVILFTGAPPASAVDAASCTVKRFDAAFDAFLRSGDGGPSGEPSSSPPSSLPQPAHAAWRSLPPPRRPPLRVDESLQLGRADFFTTADVSFGSDGGDGEDAEAAWTQFCEHSLDELHSVPSFRLDDSFASDEDASLATTSSGSGPSLGSLPPSLPPPPRSLRLSDLDDVPPARRVVALQPQTVTLNLIVGVIHIASPRAVTTRWGQALSLVEVLVGDNTATGFAVSFWLSSDSAVQGSVARLRRQDVILLQNVALHVFRGKVYGQSLRKGLTRVSLLWRRDGGGYYSTRSLAMTEAAMHEQQDKTRLVKDWVLHFVGRDPTSTRHLRNSWDKPPDDTQ